MNRCGCCPICLERYTSALEHTPRLLPCGHTFCAECLHNLAQGGTVRCPVDRQTSQVPATGYPKNFALLDVVSDGTPPEVVSPSRTAAPAASSPTCSVCDPTHPADHYCMDCREWMCMSTAQIHGKEVHDHKLLRTPLHLWCPKHCTPCLYYDHHCATLVCETCCSTTHVGHLCQDVADAGMEEGLPECNKWAKGALKDIDSAEALVRTQYKRGVSDAKDFFDRIRDMANSREAEVLADLKAKQDAVVASLAAQRRTLKGFPDSATLLRALRGVPTALPPQTVFLPTKYPDLGEAGLVPPLEASSQVLTIKVGYAAGSYPGYRPMSFAEFKRSQYAFVEALKGKALRILPRFLSCKQALTVKEGFIYINGMCIVEKGGFSGHSVTRFQPCLMNPSGSKGVPWDPSQFSPGGATLGAPPPSSSLICQLFVED